MATRVCHYLVYKIKDGIGTDWTEPDGGLVLSLRDVPRVREIARHRYGPSIIVAAVDLREREKTWQAAILHKAWELQREREKLAQKKRQADELERRIAQRQAMIHGLELGRKRDSHSDDDVART